MFLINRILLKNGVDYFFLVYGILLFVCYFLLILFAIAAIQKNKKMKENDLEIVIWRPGRPRPASLTPQLHAADFLAPDTAILNWFAALGSDFGLVWDGQVQDPRQNYHVISRTRGLVAGDLSNML